jgi:hypothetical protein
MKRVSVETSFSSRIDNPRDSGLASGKDRDQTLQHTESSRHTPGNYVPRVERRVIVTQLQVTSLPCRFAPSIFVIQLLRMEQFQYSG